MIQNWEKKNLGGLIDTQKGYAFKSDWYQNHGVAIVRVSDFTDNSISTSSILYISPEIASDYVKYELRCRDVIVQTVGSGPNNPASIVGKVICVPNDLSNALLNQNAVKLIPKSSIDIRFLYYRLKDDSFKFYCLNHSKGGANQMSITLDSIRRFEFLLPPLPTQRKIATILSAYDDLIENNLKRIKLLEEKAQLTYEEWFVKMRFPGYETAKFDEESGLPEEWEKKTIGDMIEVGRGSSPRPIADQKYFIDGSIPWLKIADATASHIYIYKTKEYVNDFGASFSRKLKPGSIIVAASGTLGFPMFLAVEACIHDGWIYFTGISDNLKEYFYFSFIGLKSYFESISYGAAIQNINTGIVKQSPFILPNKSISQAFKQVIEPYFNSINNIQKQNILLKEARDILLPRLMSGMVDVDDLEMNESLGMLSETQEVYNKR